MDWQHTLIRIYLFVCRRYERHLRAVAQRQSNNSRPDFTDEEVLALYLFGLIKKRKTIRDIYDYTTDHFHDWFPELPSYKSYNRRLNRLSAVFAPLVEEALATVGDEDTRKEAVRIADSVPIMMAKEKRSSRASVASEFADKGYCSSKGTFFYGVKLHVVGERRRGKVPVVECAGLTPGSENDLTALRHVLPTLEGGQLYGDKAYCDKAYCDGPMKELRIIRGHGGHLTVGGVWAERGSARDSLRIEAAPGKRGRFAGRSASTPFKEYIRPWPAKRSRKCHVAKRKCHVAKSLHVSSAISVSGVLS